MTKTLLLCAAAVSLTAGARAEGLLAPIENPGITTRADAEGVQAVGFRFERPAAKPSPWQASWIWVNDRVPERAWFRKEVTLDAAPSKATAWLTADKKYRLWINGRLASRGPADHGRDQNPRGTERWFYDVRDLTGYFHKGRNVIAVEVFNRWQGGALVTRGAGMLFEAQLDGTTVKSDTSWKAAPSGTTNGWQAPEFDDASWKTAVETKDIWSPLVVSEIPPLMEATFPVMRTDGLPPNKTFTNDATFRVVFDRVVSGFPQVTLKGGAGTSVQIRASRKLEFTLDGGTDRLEFPFMDSIEPAYTVELKGVRSPVEVVDAGAVFTSQPVEYRGEFSCSDEHLNKVWKAARWATQVCLQTHHLDSPLRQEPLMDAGDYCIQSAVNHYAFGQPALTRQDIRKFAWILKNEKYQNFHLSYAYAWLQMLMDYYDFTGDKALVEEMAPYVHELLDTFTGWRGKNGLICEAPNYMFMDWVNIGGIPCHHPPAVIGQGYFTAFHCHGLSLGGRIAELTGDTARAEKYRSLLGSFTEAFNRELWNPEKGLYRDGKPFETTVLPSKYLPADKQMETFSPHVNLLAVLYDLAPKERQAPIVEKVMAEQPLNAQPWFYHWVFPALDHAGLFGRYAVNEFHRWQVLPDTQSFRERWGAGTASHGWCCTPLVQMSARILGVTPATPGFKTISIRPQTCGLAWAKGKVPTPQGDVAVSWTANGGAFSLDATIPPGTEADVYLPGSETPVRLQPGKQHLNGKAPNP